MYLITNVISTDLSLLQRIKAIRRLKGLSIFGIQVNKKMKGKDLDAMLNALIRRAEVNKKFINEFQMKLERDYEAKKGMFDQLEERPRYMNYVNGKTAIDEGKMATANLMNMLYNIEEALTAEIEGYEEKKKVIEFE